MMNLITRQHTLMLLLTWISFASAGDAPPAAQLNEAILTGTMPKVIDESSGVIKSRRYADKSVYWTHNDSGDSARIFAIEESGKILREVSLNNAQNRDWEEISMDDKGRIVVCDIGDNFSKHKSFTLYRIPEPDAFDLKESAPAAQPFHYKYPKDQGPYDAEGLFIHKEFAYLFTKQLGETRLYRLPLPENPPHDTVEAEFLGSTHSLSVVTGAALSGDARHIALVNYVIVMVIDLPDEFGKLANDPMSLIKIFEMPRRSRMAVLGQTEGVCFDGRDLILTTESGKDFHIEGVGKVYSVKDAIPEK